MALCKGNTDNAFAFNQESLATDEMRKERFPEPAIVAQSNQSQQRNQSFETVRFVAGVLQDAP